MATAELGTKRACQNCGAKFYDLGRDPMTCPKCGFEHTLDMFNRNRRLRSAAVEQPRAKRAPEPDVVEAPTEEVEVEAADETEEEEASEFEDTSEFGEDDEDVADVIENVDEEDPERSG